MIKLLVLTPLMLTACYADWPPECPKSSVDFHYNEKVVVTSSFYYNQTGVITNKFNEKWHQDLNCYGEGYEVALDMNNDRIIVSPLSLLIKK